jgi:cyclase
MFRPRIIPVLLLKGQGLVKSKAFKDHRYIGDPINAVKIFNDCKADELVFLDILATKENRLISLDFVRDVGEEANMPFAVGGGIKTLNDIRSIIASGAEKVIINSSAVENPDFIRQASEEFGSSTICVCVDVKKKFLGGLQVTSQCGSKMSGVNPIEFAEMMQENGAGELILQSIEKDGQMNGYDTEMLAKICRSITVPVVALGGAGSMQDFQRGYQAGASALAAGSLFVYHGANRGVLINYPEKNDIKKLFSQS